MDGQNPQTPPPPPTGNRPPPPPPRSPQGIGASPQQPPMAAPPAPPQPQAPQAPQGDYARQQQQPGYPQQANQQPPPYGYPQQVPDQSAYAQQQPYYQYAPQQDQYYSYPAARSGFPTWIWFAGGGALLAVIGLVIVLVIALGGNRGPGSNLSAGGGQANPQAAVATYYANLLAHKYDAAFALYTPASQTQVGSAAALKTYWERIEAAGQAQGIKITNVETISETITGDTATVGVRVTNSLGQTSTTTATAQKVGNKWFIVNPGV